MHDRVMRSHMGAHHGYEVCTEGGEGKTQGPRMQSYCCCCCSPCSLRAVLQTPSWYALCLGVVCACLCTR